MGDLGREEIAARPARRFRDTAAEFAALAVLVDVATDRQVAVLAPDRLEQAGGGPKPRIERLVDTMFLEDVGRDERQLVNGLSEFGAMFPAPWIRSKFRLWRQKFTPCNHTGSAIKNGVSSSRCPALHPAACRAVHVLDSKRV